MYGSLRVSGQQGSAEAFWKVPSRIAMLRIRWEYPLFSPSPGSHTVVSYGSFRYLLANMG